MVQVKDRCVQVGCPLSPNGQTVTARPRGGESAPGAKISSMEQGQRSCSDPRDTEPAASWPGQKGRPSCRRTEVESRQCPWGHMILRGWAAGTLGTMTLPSCSSPECLESRCGPSSLDLGQQAGCTSASPGQRGIQTASDALSKPKLQRDTRSPAPPEHPEGGVTPGGSCLWSAIAGTASTVNTDATPGPLGAGLLGLPGH